MAATAGRTVTVVYAGDVIGTEVFSATSSITSPASITLQNLASGNNTITAPVGGTVLAGVTIIPPIGNTVGITLKGVSGDTGFALHKTDPTSIGLDSALTAFVLGASGGITGMRFFWT